MQATPALTVVAAQSGDMSSWLTFWAVGGVAYFMKVFTTSGQTTPPKGGTVDIITNASGVGKEKHGGDATKEEGSEDED